MAEAHERIELCLYNPVSKYARPSKLGFMEALAFRMRRTNRRMHSKTFIVDGRIAIIGGRNNEGKYYDRNPAFVFKDREVAVMGPVVGDIRNSFDEFWQHRKSVYAMQFRDIQSEYIRVVNRPRLRPSPEDLAVVGDLLKQADAPALSALRPSLSIQPVEAVEFVADSPSRRKRLLSVFQFRHRLTDRYRRLIRSAEEQLVFQTPYLIYDRRQRRDLRQARRRNPDLRVVISSNSLGAADHVHVYAISYKHRRALLRKKGLHIYEFMPFPGDARDFVPGYENLNRLAAETAEEFPVPEDRVPVDTPVPVLCLHAKTLVVDGAVALVGSHNFDPRSSNLNAECGLVIRDRAFAGRIEGDVLRDIQPRNSWSVARVPRPRRLGTRVRQSLESISSRLPFFDVVPQTYASLYQPRDGQTFLPPNHPDFYNTYEDVGQFPGVNDPAVLRRMSLIKQFGGWARPLL